MEQDEPTANECRTHGKSWRALICTHLQVGSGLRFVATPECPHGPAQAWCEACDRLVQSEHGWTKRSEESAAFSLFCTLCYAEALRRHTFTEFVRGPDEPCSWSDIRPPNE